MMTLHGLADTHATSPEPETPGERLRRLRTATGCTIGEVAAAAGLDRVLVRSFERDKAEPSHGALKRLARVYGLSLDDLSPTSAVPGGRSSEHA
jgi:transcriptional regulator with XRE-family HTH domain